MDEPAKVDAEIKLAEIASAYRPDELQRFADWYETVLNPDGNFSDVDRARRRGITVGPQGFDGMSRISGYLDTRSRAPGWMRWLAKWAAPGMCNPADEHPIVEDEPSQEAIDRDRRSAAHRNHDAFNAMVRSTLMSGELGSHQGMPVTIVATAKSTDLQAKTGMAHTGTGTMLPITDVIRMGAQAYNFLLLFDDANRIELFKGRTTRLATPAQRLVLYALERGCTTRAATCPPRGARCITSRTGPRADRPTSTTSPWPADPTTGSSKDDGWTTRKNDNGETEWIPPPELDTGQPRTNNYWHPERMLPDDEDDEESE